MSKTAAVSPTRRPASAGLFPFMPNHAVWGINYGSSLPLKMWQRWGLLALFSQKEKP